MERLWTILFVIIAVVSCGKKDAIPPKYRNTLRFQTPVDVEKVLSGWKVACDNKADCPGSVGQITIRKLNSEIDYCTAFLIDNETIMTNSHCITEPEFCSRNVTIHFPETDKFKAEKFQCDRVHEQSTLGTNPMVPDYARIKLKGAVARETLTRDQATGVKDNEELFIIKMDYQPKNPIQGLLKVQKVKVVYGSFQTPESNHPNSSIHALMDPNGVEVAIPGNSGSPVVTENKKTVKLMVQSVLDKAVLEKQLEWFPDVFKFMLKNGPSMIYASNMTCVLASNCDDVAERTGPTMAGRNILYRKKSPDDVAYFNQKLTQSGNNKVFRANLKDIEMNLQYKDGSVSTIEFQIVPECFKETSTWLEEFKTPQGYKETAKVAWPAAIFRKKVRIDKDGKPKVEYEEDSFAKGKTIDVTFSPAQVKTKNESTVNFNGQTSTLKVCGK